MNNQSLPSTKKLSIIQQALLSSSETKTTTRNKRRQKIKKQLQYIKRNLAHVEQLIDSGASLEGLNKKQYKTWLVLTEVARQQQWLFDNDKQSIEDRIVSLSPPHIRPIVARKSREKRREASKTISQLF